MKLALQRFRFAATGRWAVSIRTYLAIVFPFGYITSVERELWLSSGSFSEAALIALGGELVCALYLYISQALLLGNRKRELQPIWRCIFVWFSAGLVRGFFTAINAVYGFKQGYELGVRLPAAIFYTGVAMALAAFYFGTIERRRMEARALNSLGKVLAQEEIELNELEKAKRLSATEVIEGQLLPQVNQLKNGIKNLLASTWSTGDESQDEKTLESLYQQSLSISRSLDEQRNFYMSINPDGRTQSANQSAFSYLSAFLPKVISVRVTFVMVLVGTFTGQFARNGIEGVLAGAIGAGLITIYLIPISQAAKRELISGWVIYPVAYLGVFIIQASYNLLQPKLGIVLDFPFPAWYSGVKTTYGVFVASIIATLIISSQGKFRGEAERGADLRRKVEEISAKNSLLEESIFMSRYGTLQGKITGVTMALHLMGEMKNVSTDKRSKLLSDANEMLAESIVQIEQLKVLP